MSNNDQPTPVKNALPCVQDMVIKDIKDRKQVGIERYGTTLQPFNGRSALWDAYHEAIDLCQYLRQLIYELENPQVVFSDDQYNPGYGHGI